MATRLDAVPVVTTHLSPDQLDGLRRLLLDEHAAQQARAVELRDPVDLEPDLAEVLLGRCQESLEEIEAALELIDRGTYGHCADCGAAIRYERLEAVPATRHCVDCLSGRSRIPR